MTKKQGNALPAGIYKVFWKRGGWSWGAIGQIHNRILNTNESLAIWVEKGMPSNFDRDIMCYNWSGSLKGSRMWRKIAKVERAKLAKMPNER